jgi:hypothetical protein
VNNLLPEKTEVYFFRLNDNLKMHLVRDKICGYHHDGEKLWYITLNSMFEARRLGRNVFLTKEEAENRLNMKDEADNPAKRRKIDKDFGM